MSQDYASIAKEFPRHIPFPMVERRHRSGKLILSEVKTVDDLPSRLIFGDLIRDTFTVHPDGWSAQFRDAQENCTDLSVHSGQFEAKSRFLGIDGLSVGPAAHPRAFGEASVARTPHRVTVPSRFLACGGFSVIGMLRKDSVH